MYEKKNDKNKIKHMNVNSPVEVEGVKTIKH